MTSPEALAAYQEGLRLYGQEDYAAAIEAYDRALALEPGWSDCLQAKGMAQMHAGALREALSTLQRATELAPEDPFAFTSLSMVHVRLGNIDEAEKAQAQARMLTWKQETESGPGPGA